MLRTHSRVTIVAFFVLLAVGGNFYFCVSHIITRGFSCANILRIRSGHSDLRLSSLDDSNAKYHSKNPQLVGRYASNSMLPGNYRRSNFRFSENSMCSGPRSSARLTSLAESGSLTTMQNGEPIVGIDKIYVSVLNMKAKLLEQHLKMSSLSAAYASLASDLSVFCLAIISGGIIGALVLQTRSAIVMVDSFRSKNPITAPIIGGLFVSMLYCIQPDLNLGSDTIYPATPGPLKKLLALTSNSTAEIKVKSIKNRAGDIIRDLSTNDGIFSVQRQLFRWVGLIATLGSGCAMALTGPATELGMTVGRILGFNVLKSESSRRQLILAAAGAGMTANFDTPLTGVFFALEINRLMIKNRVQPDSALNRNNINGIINTDVKDIAKSDVIALFLAATTSSMMCRKGFVGKAHFLSMINYQVGPLRAELGLFIVLGILTGLLAAVYEQLRDAATEFLKNVPKKFRPIIGGLACSFCASYGRQQSFVTGFEAVAKIVGGAEGAFRNPLYLVKFIVEKTSMIAICMASGQIGGPFAHAIFTGSALGALFRTTVLSLWRGFATFLFSFIFSIPPSSRPLPIALALSSRSTYALLGLAGTVAAYFKSPITACMLVLELTRQIDHLLPLLAVTGAAAFTINIINEAKSINVKLKERRRILDLVI